MFWFGSVGDRCKLCEVRTEVPCAILQMLTDPVLSASLQDRRDGTQKPLSLDFYGYLLIMVSGLLKRVVVGV